VKTRTRIRRSVRTGRKVRVRVRARVSVENMITTAASGYGASKFPDPSV